MRWITMKLGPDIHGAQRRNANDTTDTMRFTVLAFDELSQQLFDFSSSK